MRVIIAGSRNIKGDYAVEQIEAAIAECGWEITEVVSGDAPGVDTAAVTFAKKHNIDYVVIPANWEKYKKAAGYKRNQKMAWYVQQARLFCQYHDIPIDDNVEPGLIAIWNGTSTGTNHMINIAQDACIKVHIKKVLPNPKTS